MAKPAPQGLRLAEPTAQRLGAMKRKDPTRTGLRVAVVAGQDFRFGRDILESALPRIDTQPFRRLGDVSGRLVRISAKRGPSGLRLDHPAKLLIDEKPIIARPRSGAELAHSYSRPRGEIEAIARLDDPTARGQLIVKRRAGAILRSEEHTSEL